MQIPRLLQLHPFATNHSLFICLWIREHAQDSPCSFLDRHPREKLRLNLPLQNSSCSFEERLKLSGQHLRSLGWNLRRVSLSSSALHQINYAFLSPQVVCGSKYIVRGESPRDHVDLLASSRHWPPVYVVDLASSVALCADICYPDLTAQMWGRNQGCFSDPMEPLKVSCLAPVHCFQSQ